MERSPDEIVTCPSHTQDAFNIFTMPRIVKWGEEKLLEFEADAIVACGHSGLVIAGALSYVTRIPLFAARRDGEETVASGDCSNEVSAYAPNGKAKRWVWVDDVIGTGGTLWRSAWKCYHSGLVESEWPSGILLYTHALYGGFFDRRRFELECRSADGEYTGLRRTIPARYFKHRDEE